MAGQDRLTGNSYLSSRPLLLRYIMGSCDSSGARSATQPRLKPMTNQTQHPNESKHESKNESKSASKGGPPQSQQAQDDSHTNSSRAGERVEHSDPSRKGGTQHGANTPQGGQQQGMEPDRTHPGSQQHGSQGHQGQQGGQKSNDPPRNK
jgi:hypothetical protein